MGTKSRVSINHELYEKVVRFFIYSSLSKTTNCMKSRKKISPTNHPENGNFGLYAFSSSFTYQNVQICNVWLFSRTVAMET